MFLLYLMIAAGLIAGTIYMARLATDTDQPDVGDFDPEEEAQAAVFEIEDEGFPGYNPTTGIPYPPGGNAFGPDLGGYLPGQFVGDR